jgi:arylsulfatase A-like enzyme
VAGLLLLAAGCGGKDAPAPAPVVYDADGRAAAPVSRPDGPPNLVVILVDTLRGDALRADGDADAPTRMPFLASLARHGVSFPEAITPSAWTVPSIVSLLTGLLPSAHGADDAMPSPALRLRDSVTTYAEVLSETYGYETAAFLGGPWYGTSYGFFQGFEKGGNRFALQGTEEVVGAWAAERDPDRPFFLFLHTFEVHDPYGEHNHPWPTEVRVPPPAEHLRNVTDVEAWARAFFLDFEERTALTRIFGGEYVKQTVAYMNGTLPGHPRPGVPEALREAYFQGVRWFDGVLERAVTHLEALGLLEDTVLVVTSDHGEAFGEHGILGHGRQLYDELVRVPLVIVGPEPFQGGRRIPGTVGLVDVLPTFFAYAGLTDLDGIHGVSALPRVRGEIGSRPVVSEERLDLSKTAGRLLGRRVSVRSPRWKYILTYDARRGRIGEEAYDLAADPAEQHDFARGTGRLSRHLPFDEAYCAAVDRIRASFENDGTPDPGMADFPEADATAAATAAAVELPPAPCTVER